MILVDQDAIKIPAGNVDPPGGKIPAGNNATPTLADGPAIRDHIPGGNKIAATLAALGITAKAAEMAVRASSPRSRFALARSHRSANEAPRRSASAPARRTRR